MGSSNYQYKRPKGIKYNLSIKAYNSRFAKRGRYPFTSVEVYVEEDQAKIFFRPSLVGKGTILLISPFMYPLLIIKYGYEETHTAFKDVFFDKQRGAFTEERIYRRHELQWDWLMNELGIVEDLK